MSAAGELEALDNASLRAKCLEFGLPNVPITDTSRKVLIKKLRMVMTGENADKSTKKNRRETIHVTKIPTPVETTSTTVETEETVVAPKRPPSRTNRRTIAGTSSDVSVRNEMEHSTVKDAPDSKPATAPVPAPVVNRRKSSQDEMSAFARVPAEKRKTIVIEEEEDEDDLVIVEAVEKSEKSNRIKAIPRSRESRSVSLSKTGVVTTSYSHEVAPAPLTAAETESDTEIDDDLTESYIRAFDNPRSSYVPLAATGDRSNLRDHGLGFSHKPVGTSSTFGSEYSKTTYPTSTNNPPIEPMTYKPSLPPRYSTLGMYSPSVSTTTTASRRYTTSEFATPSSVQKYSTAYNENSDDHEDGEHGNSNIPAGTSPYLSNFARKLELLKSEPLKGSDMSVKGDLSSRLSYSSKVTGRRPTNQKETVSESIWNLFLALNRKYNLKKNFAIFGAVVAVVFIYIVFIR